MTRFAFFTFSGYSLPIAKRLQDEGNDVLVGVVLAPEKLNVSGWQGKKETKEEKECRLSLYDNMLEKQDADKLIKQLSFEKDKGTTDDLFVVVDHNNLCEYGDKLNALGLTGLVPLREDYEREKDREAAKKFVEKYYDILDIPESYSLKSAEDGVDLVEDSDDMWVLKGNGNVGETIVPKTNDTSLNHTTIIGALKCNREDYETNGFLLEKKIKNHIEFTPQLTFWNGEPIYSQVEIECKPIGAGDIGPDGGGAINLIVKTNLDDEINELFFPPIVYEMAKKRRGLFLFDAGILYDTDNERFYFTEFAGNRWSWGGVFSELAMATNKNRNASEYFSRVAAGKNPLRYNFGATVALYQLFPKKNDTGHMLCWRRAADEYFWPYQVKEDDSGYCVSVDCGDPLLAYASGCGDSLAQCVNAVYKVVDNVAFCEVMYRPKCDFLSREYSTSILCRFEALKTTFLNVPGFREVA